MRSGKSEPLWFVNAWRIENMAIKKATLQQIRDVYEQWKADRKMAWQVLVEIGDILEEAEKEDIGL